MDGVSVSVRGTNEMLALWTAMRATADVMGGGTRNGVRSQRNDYDSAGVDTEEEEMEAEDDDVMRSFQTAHATTTMTSTAPTSSFFSSVTDLNAFMTQTQSSATDELQSSTFLEELLGSESDTFGSGMPHASSTTTPSVTHPPPSYCGTPHVSKLSAERLSQLEDNYERKKKRAKINRRDLNSRFTELMEILNLREDRKLNRAKILETAIEHIHKLTAELEAVKAQLDPNKLQTATRSNQFGASTQSQPRTKALPLPPHWPPHAIAVPTPVMWMPVLPAMSPHAQAPVRPVPMTARQRKAAMATSTASTAQAPPPRSSQDSVGPVRRVNLKRARVESTRTVPRHETSSMSGPIVSSNTTLMLLWTAREVPTLLAYCDAWSLCSVMATCRDLSLAARDTKLWAALCRHRWRLEDEDEDEIMQDARVLWREWHQSPHKLPHSLRSIITSGVHFASGRSKLIAVWGFLAHRSNGRTTRAVLVGGKAVVRQVVELYVVVQNLQTTASVRLTDELTVQSSSSAFRLINSDSRAHLTPHLLALNNTPCSSLDVRTIELFHGDLCAFSVFVECDGLDLEEQFLERVEGLTMPCEVWKNNRMERRVDVHAGSIERKQELIASTYAPTAKSTADTV
ncbi:hypothetical protein Poli38472_005014 [Pythium oligandrum]|uniref:BHLH domain-containing protein n=1 Tax=Pythium oligandrum TaxID=41045 RepID=A0A8K1CBU9_PYTOL|nr:hypothetical protein Poli38472_005014 [Pythium oligandrum]|eukprot:TMW59945.1 hypothetical protein Poli38472_005014 [Pythium oligandrum]